MKLIRTLFVILFVISFASCRDTKKEEDVNDVTTEIEQVETEIGSEIDEVTESVNKQFEELEEALKELDSI